MSTSPLGDDPTFSGNASGSGSDGMAETVGRADADADAARSGADLDGGVNDELAPEAGRDTDGAAVGHDDLAADVAESGGDAGSV